MNPANPQIHTLEEQSTNDMIETHPHPQHSILCLTRSGNYMAMTVGRNLEFEDFGHPVVAFFADPSGNFRTRGDTKALKFISRSDVGSWIHMAGESEAPTIAAKMAWPKIGPWVPMAIIRDGDMDTHYLARSVSHNGIIEWHFGALEVFEASGLTLSNGNSIERGGLTFSRDLLDYSIEWVERLQFGRSAQTVLECLKSFTPIKSEEEVMQVISRRRTGVINHASFTEIYGDFHQINELVKNGTVPALPPHEKVNPWTWWATLQRVGAENEFQPGAPKWYTHQRVSIATYSEACRLIGVQMPVNWSMVNAV